MYSIAYVLKKYVIDMSFTYFCFNMYVLLGENEFMFENK